MSLPRYGWYLAALAAHPMKYATGFAVICFGNYVINYHRHYSIKLITKIYMVTATSSKIHYLMTYALKRCVIEIYISTMVVKIYVQCIMTCPSICSHQYYFKKDNIIYNNIFCLIPTQRLKLILLFCINCMETSLCQSNFVFSVHGFMKPWFGYIVWICI